LQQSFTASMPLLTATSAFGVLLKAIRNRPKPSGTILLQQNPPVVDWGCWLTKVVLYNCHKMAVAVS